jgi:hypothetical protein
VSEQTAARAEPAAEARQRRPETPTPVIEPGEPPAFAAPGLVSQLLFQAPGEDETGRGMQNAIAQNMLRLQRSRGNQYVQRLARSQRLVPAKVLDTPAPDSNRAQANANEHINQPQVGLHRTDPAAIQRQQKSTAVTLTTGPVQNRIFSVTGDSLRAAGSQLNRRSEWGRGGAENIAYSAGAVDADGIVTSIRITAVLFTELPNWRGLASKSERVRNEWNRMLGALRGHENNHVSIARTHLQELRSSLNGVTEDELPTLWREKIAALQAAQDEYDTSTTSGQTEGVTLDLSVEEEGATGQATAVVGADIQPSVQRHDRTPSPPSLLNRVDRQDQSAEARGNLVSRATMLPFLPSAALLQRDPEGPPAPVATTMPGPASQVIPWRSYDVPLDPGVQRKTLEYITGKSGSELAIAWAKGFYSLELDELVKLLIDKKIEESVIAQARTDLRSTAETFKRDVDEFKKEFQDTAEGITKELLDNSQKKIEGELEHYGVGEMAPGSAGTGGTGGAGPVSGGGGAEGGPAAGPLGLKNPGAVADMKTAARELATKRREADKSGSTAKKAREDAQAKVKQFQGQALANAEMPAGWLDPAENQRIKELTGEWQRLEREYAGLCQEKHAKFPLLAMYSFAEDAATQLEALAAKPEEETAETILAESRKRLENIATVRAELGGRFNIWKQGHIKHVTRQQMNAKPWQTRVVEEKSKEVEQAEADDKVFWACVAIGLGLLAAIPSGGSSVLAGVSAAAAALGATLTVREALEDIAEYSLESAANGTDFDKANAISQEEPEYFWLAMDLVSAALDIYGAAAAWKTLKEAIKAAESSGDLIKFLNTVDEVAPATARGPIVARAVSKMKSSGAIDGAIEAVGDRFRQGDLNRIRELIKEAATQDWHDAFEQMVQAGKVRPLTPRGLREALKSYAPLRQKKYANYADELWLGEQVWKSDGIFDPVSGMMFIKPGREGDVAGNVIHEMTHVAQAATGTKEFKFWQEFEAYAAQRKFIQRLEKLAPGSVSEGWAFLKDADDLDIARHIEQIYGFQVPNSLIQATTKSLTANAQTKALAAAKKVLALPR